MRYYDQWLIESQLYFDFMKTNKVSPIEVKKRGLFGPIYHGTTEQGREAINQMGFKPFVGAARTGEVVNGFELTNWWLGIPPPIHMLGFGVYFTTIKSIAKKFNQGTTKGLKSYYIDAPRFEKINFGVNKTMMEWWQKNGYDMKPIRWSSGTVGSYQGIKILGDTPEGEVQAIEKERVKATINLTNTLKSKYDAVWYKGKSMKTLLDGDQVCVYDISNIYELDNESWEGYHIGGGIYVKTGDRFLIRGTKATAVIKNLRKIGSNHSRDIWDIATGKDSNYMLEIGEKKNWDSVIEVYKDKLKELLKKHHAEFLKERASNNSMSEEENLESLVNFYIRDTMNFPSSLIERVLKKGGKIK